MDCRPPLSQSPSSSSASSSSPASSSSSASSAGEVSSPLECFQLKDSVLSTSGPRALAVLSGHVDSVNSLALCGEFVLSASGSEDIIVWQQPDLRRYATFGEGEGSVKAVVVTGNRVFTAHQDKQIRVWKVSRHKENAFRLLTTLPQTKDCFVKSLWQSNYVETRRHHKKLWIEHADCISCLAVYGDTLYSGSWDKAIKVWSVRDLRCLESFNAHDDAVNDLVAAVDSGVIYSASADGTIKVWERQEEQGGSTSTSSSKWGFRHCQMGVLTVEGQRDGTAWNAVVLAGEFVYGGTSDGRVVGWQQTEEREWTVACDVRAHNMAVLCLCVVGDNVVCSGSADRSVSVWSKRDNGELTRAATVNGHDGPVKCLQGSRHGQGMGGGAGFVLYSGGLDKTVRVWWVPDDWGLAAGAGGDGGGPSRPSFSSSDTDSSSAQEEEDGAEA